MRRDQMNISFINRPERRLHVQRARVTGNAAADFLLGFPAQCRPDDQAIQDWTVSAWLYAGYVQDEFRVTPP